MQSEQKRLKARVRELTNLESAIQRLEKVADSFVESLDSMNAAVAAGAAGGSTEDSSTSLKSTAAKLKTQGLSLSRCIRRLMAKVFTDDELSVSNLSGANDKAKLDEGKVREIEEAVTNSFPTATKGAIHSIMHQKCVEARMKAAKNQRGD